MTYRFLAALLFICSCSYAQTKSSDTIKFAEIQGQKQYYLIKGNGSPAVVFISGLGLSMDEFVDMQNKLCKTNQTLCYDRAGIGKSEPLKNSRRIEDISDELKELLDKVGFDKPIILVAHSRGALIARYFVNKYPDNVRGIVLIDPAIPELKWKKRELRTLKEKEEFDTYYNSFCTDTLNYSETIRNEFKAPDSLSMVGKNFPLDIPITILASNKETKDKYSKQETKIKVASMQEYVKMAPQIKLIWTKKSGHFIYEDEPTLVLNEIQSMITKVK